MDKAMEQAFSKVDKQMERISFIFKIALSVCLAVAGLLFVIFESTYPSEDDLVYEECTFIRYEYGKNKSKYCRIYVNEYEKPLEITSVAKSQIDEDVLRRIQPGESIWVSIDREGRLSVFIYSAVYKEEPILAYKDYLASHASNDRIRVVLGWIFFALSGLVISSQSSKYALKGKTDRFYSRFSPDRPTARDIANEIKQMRKKKRKGREGATIKKHQLLIAMVPFLGSFVYSFMDRERFLKALWATLVGMGGCMATFGSIAAISNVANLDLTTNQWLLYLTLGISGMIWNVIYFGLFNKLSK